MQNNPTMTQLQHWERCLSAAHSRFLRALDSLARIRRLPRSKTVQVNIATEGGQQLNVAHLPE